MPRRIQLPQDDILIGEWYYYFSFGVGVETSLSNRICSLQRSSQISRLSPEEKFVEEDVSLKVA